MPWINAPVKTFIFVVLLMMLQGCASRQVLLLETLPLPAAKDAPCCWQALMEAEITFQGERQQLLAALAFGQDEYSLALLDSVGQRLFSLHYIDGEIKHYQSPLLPEAIPEKVLQAMHYLTWWPLASWPVSTIESAEQQAVTSDPWKIKSESSNRQLYYKHRAMLSVDYEQPVGAVVKPPQVGERFFVQHPLLEFTMQLTTRQWQAL